MLSVEFQTGALLVLVAAALAIAWILWIERQDRRAAVDEAIAGIGHEMRIVVQRFMAELSAISHGEQPADGDLLPIQHPQYDAICGTLIPANRTGLSVIGAHYLALQARKTNLRAAFAQGREPLSETAAAIDALIDAIATLYMWEAHHGVRPSEAPSTRSWRVRAWMKGHGMRADMFPGMHLRDQVVERLRSYGMTLTPRPLTHTAHEYYSMRYDRRADPRAPFGKRREPRKPLAHIARVAEQIRSRARLPSPERLGR